MIGKYLSKIQDEQVTTSVSAGISPYESPSRGKPLYDKTETMTKITEQTEEVKRLMIDLDGTIHKYSKGFLDGSIYDDPVEGSKETLEYFKDNGFEIIIFTSRLSREGTNTEEDIIEWLEKWGIPYDSITADKLPAVAYIDDRNLRFSSWKTTINVLKKLSII